jgi:hypothetical protein
LHPPFGEKSLEAVGQLPSVFGLIDETANLATLALSLGECGKSLVIPTDAI